MKLKKLLKLISSDTKIEVIFKDDYDALMSEPIPIFLDPSEYPRHENLQVESLSVGKNSSILYVYINATGYYYNYKTDKYEKATLNGV